MTKFLNIRSIGRPIVSICGLAISLLVASTTGAVAQNVANDAFLKALFPTSSKWAAPSPSCTSRKACNADPNFQQEFTNFVSFMNTRYPSAQVPSAARLQRHVCNTLAPGGSLSTDDQADEELDSVKMGQWLASYISFSYWSTQPGLTPYQTSPVWWCFLDNNTNYVIEFAEQFTGVDEIIPQFAGLGKSVADGGQGFYVNQATITDIYPAISLDPGFYVAQTYTNKELIAIPAGTTKPLSQYQSLMKLQAHDTYPRRTISFIQETINKFATIEWLGLCAACINCTPGTVCSSS